MGPPQINIAWALDCAVNVLRMDADLCSNDLSILVALKRFPCGVFDFVDSSSDVCVLIGRIWTGVD